ncbi:MAG TPA: tetratricopeptide repeat protein [Longimicrobiales bacterium]|nr:tetratricopeptide repeat protein [Longimicrobiales bacterium]
MRTITMILTAVALAAAQPSPAAGQQPEDAAAAAWAAGELDRARELYAARVAADSGDVQALHRLGLLHAWDRDFATALPLLRRLVALAPSRPARTDLARVLSWSGRHGEAATMYRALLADDDGDAEALRGLARVTTWSGDLPAGEGLWRQLVAADGDDAEARIGLSQVLRWTGRPWEALEHARVAIRLRPGDRDAMEQLAWAESAVAPRMAPTFSAEVDSDDNRLYTTALAATGHVAPWLGLSLDAYLRRAEGPTPMAAGEVSRDTRAVSAAVRLFPGGGWMLSAGAGVVDRPAAGGGGTTGTWRGGVASPARLPVTAAVNYARAALDATADLMGRGVTTDDVTGTVTARLSGDLSVEAAGGVTRFHGETENRRTLGRLGLEARPVSWLRVRPRVTAFRFRTETREGYFAPDEYVMGEVGVGVERHGTRWSVTGEVAPGAQRIGSDGDVGGAVSARTRVARILAPGREVALGLSFSNLGMDSFATGAADYRYQAVVLSASWGF